MYIGPLLAVIIVQALLLGGLHRWSDDHVHHNRIPAGPHPTPLPTARTAGAGSLRIYHQCLLKEVPCTLTDPRVPACCSLAGNEFGEVGVQMLDTLGHLSSEMAHLYALKVSKYLCFSRNMA